MNRLLSFILFFTIFLSIYGGLHFYFYWKIIRAFEISTANNLLLIFILFLLLLSPFITNISSNTDRFLATTILAYISYIWMAVLFLFFSINIMIDCYSLIIFLSARFFSPHLISYIPGDRITLLTVLLITAGINLYGWFEAGNIGVERIILNTDKLPPRVRSLRVVQISDTHFSSTNGMKLAKKVHDIIKGLKPDLLVSSGDLYDGGLKDKEAIIELFRDLEPPYGKYACAGNHEFIHGIERTSAFIEKAGFRFLRNEGVKVGDFLNIAAIDDPTVNRSGNELPVSEDSVIATFSDDRLNIFLKHQPRVQATSIGKFDIQLSGHTHKGQIFPFTLIGFRL